MALLALGMAASALVQAPAAPATTDEPDYYVCAVAREGPFGRISYGLEVPVDEPRRFHRIRWQHVTRARGLLVSAQWSGWSAPERFPDAADVLLRFSAARPERGEVRLELRRATEARPVWAGSYWHTVRAPRDAAPDASGEMHWGELRTLMGDGAFLIAALVRRDGLVIGEDRLDAAMLVMPDAAIAAATPDLEAMALSYRSRCARPQTIIVT